MLIRDFKDKIACIGIKRLEGDYIQGKFIIESELLLPKGHDYTIDHDFMDEVLDSE